MTHNDHNTDITTYNREAEETLAFVRGEVIDCHIPEPANDNAVQLSFDFMTDVSNIEAQKGVKRRA